jgi:hypothetical protein
LKDQIVEKTINTKIAKKRNNKKKKSNDHDETKNKIQLEIINVNKIIANKRR